MKSDILRSPAAALLAMLCATPASQAHHSVAAEFDPDKPITFTGTVQKIAWLNPHIYTHVEVKAADGTTVVYRIEGGPPNSLYRQGWRKDTLKTGDTVTVSGNRARNPESTNVGQARITNAAGLRIFSGAGPAAPPTAP